MTIDSARRRLHEIIFDADTPAGRAFDVAQLILIVVSVIAVMLETVAVVRDLAGNRPAAVERELR
jgi:voltage-gated potassium channel